MSRYQELLKLLKNTIFFVIFTFWVFCRININIIIYKENNVDSWGLRDGTYKKADAERLRAFFPVFFFQYR